MPCSVPCCAVTVTFFVPVVVAFLESLSLVVSLSDVVSSSPVDVVEPESELSVVDSFSESDSESSVGDVDSDAESD